MSDFVKFAVDQGVPIETVTLILMLPIVVTIIAFFRQIVGIKAFGIYTPTLVTFAFFGIGIDADSFLKGMKYGISIFVTVIAIGTLTRIILKRLRLLYLPRVAIVITIVSFSTLMILILGGALQRTGLASVSIFPILIMVALVEKFVSTQIEKGARTAVILSVETLIISLVCYTVVSWRELVGFVQQYPWIILIILLINFALGKWTGLRISEYIRFKHVIKNAEHPKK
ncbi:MAG: 7TM domain-containing protein [Patescibacteria group bacterium]|nr:7TM domain-containing protein [Patescibacteria group bacterium]